MYKFRKILTGVCLVMAIVFLQGCSRELKNKELMSLENMTDQDIEHLINKEVYDLVKNYEFIDMDGFKLVHDLNDYNNKYQVVIDLGINEDIEGLQERIEGLSGIIAHRINTGDLADQIISNVNINWRKESPREDEAIMYYSYELGKRNPEVKNKYIGKAFK